MPIVGTKPPCDQPCPLFESEGGGRAPCLRATERRDRSSAERHSQTRSVPHQAGHGAAAVLKHLLDAAIELGAESMWRSAGVSLRIRDPGGSSQMLTLFVLTTAGEAYTGWLGSQLHSVGVEEPIASEFNRLLNDAFPQVSPKKEGADYLERALRWDELAGREEQFLGTVRWVIAGIQNHTTS